MIPEKLRSQLEQHLDKIELETEGASIALVRAEKSRSIDDVLGRGILAGKVQAIAALVKDVRETLDE